MNLNRYEVKRYLARFRVGPNDVLRHGSFDSKFGVRSNYLLLDVKKWLVWSGVEIIEYRD